MFVFCIKINACRRFIIGTERTVAGGASGDFCYAFFFFVFFFGAAVGLLVTAGVCVAEGVAVPAGSLVAAMLVSSLPAVCAKAETGDKIVVHKRAVKTDKAVSFLFILNPPVFCL